MRIAALAAALSLAACAPGSPTPIGDDPSEESSNALESHTLTLRPDVVLASRFEGFGAQYNQNLYSDKTRDRDGVTPANINSLSAKLAELHAGYVRVFFDYAATPDEQDSFSKTIHLATSAGARVNITYWHGPYTDPKGQMQAFAQVLSSLLTTAGGPPSVDVTIQNEVNTTPCVTKARYADLYVQLDGALRALGTRDKVRFIGGDLLLGTTAPATPEKIDARVKDCIATCGYTKEECADKGAADASTQEAWLNDFASREVKNVPNAQYVSDMFAAYSAHIYWDYWDRDKMINRLDGLQSAISSLPARAHKPLMITEFGARGVATDKVIKPGVYSKDDPALDADGKAFLASNNYPIADTFIEAFQTGRFGIEALKRGAVGIIRWDAYKAAYQDAPLGDFSMLKNPDKGWDSAPSFDVMALLDQAGKRDWNVIGVDGDDRHGIVAAALGGPNGGRSLFVANDTAANQKISVHGFPKSRGLVISTWKRGTGTEQTSMSTDTKGAVTVPVPLHGIVSVTTKP